MNKLGSITALISGIIFGLGLVISGMTDTHKVIGFLDISDWDYDLAFVMMGAISISIVAFYLAKRIKKPIFESKFYLPTNAVIERKIIIGGMIFGIGWGLYGLCPAPAVIALLYGNITIYLFFISMIIGFFVSSKTPWFK